LADKELELATVESELFLFDLRYARRVVSFVKVGRKTGSITDAEVDRTTVHSYEMRVGGVQFDNANPALIEYMQGDIYAVYYTNSTRQILSVEFISKG